MNVEKRARTLAQAADAATFDVRMTTAKKLRFHAATFELTGKQPGRSRRALDLLTRRERQCGIRFPAAVREWYLAGGPGLGSHIGCGKTADQMVALRELGRPLANWYAMGSADFVAAGLLVVMHENQGVCTWAVKLDGSDDPPVVVEVDSSAKAARLSAIRWQRCAASFSTFMYCRAWDHGHALHRIARTLFAQDEPLARRDLAFLRAHFTEGPRTFGHPGTVNHRFFTDDSAILIWAGKDQSDWHLMAASEEALLRLLRQVSRCGTLTETLYALGDPRAAILLLANDTDPGPHRRRRAPRQAAAPPSPRRRARHRDRR